MTHLAPTLTHAMLLTMKARYAIRALTALARHNESRPMLTLDIARIENIPRRFLSGIMLELRRHSLLVSRRGRHGGYVLKRPPEEITIATVLSVVGNPIASEPCVRPVSRDSCKDCPESRICGARLVLERICAATRSTLERTTIAELARRATELTELESTRPKHFSPQTSLPHSPSTLSSPREIVKHV
jgi:Rrf2 family protein